MIAPKQWGFVVYLFALIFALESSLTREGESHMYVIVSLLGLPREEYDRIGYWILAWSHTVLHRILSLFLFFLIRRLALEQPRSRTTTGLQFARHFVYTSCRRHPSMPPSSGFLRCFRFPIFQELRKVCLKRTFFRMPTSSAPRNVSRKGKLPDSRTGL